MRNYDQDQSCASAAKALSGKVQQTLEDMSALQAQEQLCRELSLEIDALTKSNSLRLRTPSVAPAPASSHNASSPEKSVE